MINAVINAVIDAGIVLPSGLVADVYRPAQTPAPAVVTRTPYDRAALHGEGMGWARHGFAFVAQDVRGRYGSPGTWYPYRGEREDGAELVDWVRDQPWCDGNVIVAGASYAAFTAWATAVTTPVAAVVSHVPAMSTERVRFDPSGILRLTEHAGWWTEHAEARTSRTGLAAAMLTADPDLLRHLPVRDIGERLWARVPGWWDAVAAKNPEAVTDDELAGCEAPTLHVGGWYDPFAAETLHQWEITGSTLKDRPLRALLLGPWRHELSTPDSATVGLRDHGPSSQLPIGPYQADWLRTVLAGTAQPSTRVFRMGDNTWLDTWPKVTPSTWYPHADGSLSIKPPAQGQRTFTYDPANPCPSVSPGHDRQAVTNRPDVLAFRTPSLTKPLHLTGRPHVRLAATSSAPETDWVVRLSEQRPDGTVIELTTGVTTNGDVTLAATAVTVPTGSRLELSVTSSDFPWLARALNTGADRYTTTDTATATQTIHIGPTAVVLPEADK